MTTAAKRKAAREKRAVHPGELMGGYPGLALTAHLISNYIPKCKIYCEPFAGLGRTAPFVTADKKILNDKSDHAVKYLKRFFPYATVSQLDFAECMINNDSKNTFFLIDPPWFKAIYEEKSLPFCDREPVQYYTDILNICKKLKGDWIICSSKEQHGLGGMLEKSGYPQHLVTSGKKIFGKNAVTMLTAKNPILMRCQSTLWGE